MKFPRKRLTYSNVASSLALFLALTGTAVAAATLTGAEIVDESLTGADIKNGSIAKVDLGSRDAKAFKFAPSAGSIPGGNTAKSGLPATVVATGSVTTPGAGVGSITAAVVAESSILEAQDNLDCTLQVGTHTSSGYAAFSSKAPVGLPILSGPTSTLTLTMPAVSLDKGTYPLTLSCRSYYPATIVGGIRHALPSGTAPATRYAIAGSVVAN